MAPLAHYFHDELLDTAGNALSLASVLVKKLDGTNATIYTSATMGTSAGNPKQADARGNFEFYGPDPQYDLIVTPQGGTAQTPYRVTMGLAPGQGGRIDALETRGRIIPTDYMLSRSGTTYRLIKGLDGAEVGNGPEPGALMQNAITALGLPAGKVVIGGPEDFDWGSVPTIPAGITRRLTITSTGPVVNLSAAAPRFLDPAANPAVGSTFRNLTLDNIPLNAAAIPTTETGHLLFGNARSGNLYSQINFAGLRFLRCKIEGAHATSGKVLNPIYLGVQQTADGQPENFVRDIIVNDLVVSGGLMAVSLVGVRAAGWTGIPNIWIDGWAISNVRHDIGSVPAGFATSSHVHVGAWGKVGRGVIENTYGYGSRDVCIELNNYQDVAVNNVTFDEYNGFAVLLTNHIAPRRVRDQRAEVRNVSGRHLAANNAVVANDASSLVCVQAKPGIPMGDTTVDGMKYYRDIGRMAGLNGIGLRIDGEHRSVAVEHGTVQAEGVNHSSTTEQAYPKWISLDPANLTPVRLNDVEVRVNGTVAAGAAAHQLLGVRITGSLDLKADDLRVGIDVTGAADFQTRGVEIGGAATTLKGGIRRFKLGPMAETKPRGILVSGTATVTIPARFDIDGDFSGNAATQSLDVAVGAGNEHFVHRRPGSVWKVTPAPVAITVGTSPFIYRNVSGFRQRVIVRGGTVSEVAWSRDGAAFTIVNTTTGVVIEVENGEHVRVTYSAAPTMTAIPVT